MPAPAPRILIADDQPDILEALRLLLEGERFEIETAASPEEVIRAAQARDFDVVLIDLNYTQDTTSGREGLNLLSVLRGGDETLPVVVMTAWGSVEGAVEAMRRGAGDFIEKPWDNQRLITILRTQIELGRALRRSQRLESENELLRREGLPEMIAGSEAMQPVLDVMERIGPTDADVLITGEHGTGKDVVARWLHAASPRANHALVTVNAGALGDGVFESEMFGHVKGAFTDARSDRAGYFELADEGTIFLDEIGTMPPDQQAKLLRVLQSGELQRVGSGRTRTVDVRVISATNVDIRTEVSEDRFREDLYYRLNTVEIRLPPLRERIEDIPPLAMHFLGRAAERYRKSIAGFDPEALRQLEAHTWPGNVRELEHAVERGVLMCTGETVRADDLALQSGARDGSALLESMTLEEAEEHLIRRALARSAGNVSHAANALGLSRSALYRRLQRYAIPTSEHRR